MVAEKDAEAALKNIDEYYMTVHPKLRESQEWADQDRCPACGHHVSKDAKECSACGLLLIIEGKDYHGNTRPKDLSGRHGITWKKKT